MRGPGRSTRLPRGVLLALLLAMAPAILLAQETPKPPKPQPPPEPAPPVESPWARGPGPTFPHVFGYRAGGPMRHSAYFGWSWLETRTEGPYGERAGPYAVVETGLGGVQVGAGKASHGPHLGVAHWQASLLRTFGDPLRVEPDQTFLGGEVRIGLAFVAVGLVAYQRLSLDHVGERFAGASLVIGF